MTLVPKSFKTIYVLIRILLLPKINLSKIYCKEYPTMITFKSLTYGGTYMEYGLIGEKLAHSYSKYIHEGIGNYSYILNPLSKDEFHNFMKRKEFKGINVTIPYKKDVMPYLDEIDEKAKEIGAVNTIVNQDNYLIGYNTDYYGFLYTLNYNQIDVKLKKVLVLGTGGAAKSVICVLKDLGASHIITVKHRSTDGAISYDEAINLHQDAYLVVNTSPVGMYPNTEASPLDLSKFPNLVSVVDLIYNPLKTKLLEQGESLGCITANGLLMLVVQAIFASEYFHSTKYPLELTHTIYDSMCNKLQE